MPSKSDLHLIEYGMGNPEVRFKGCQQELGYREVGFQATCFPKTKNHFSPEKEIFLEIYKGIANKIRKYVRNK